MATAAQFVAKAASQIGTKESPSGSNKQKYGVWYGMDGQPWCDMFVSWCAAQVGASGIVGKYAYCPSHVNYAKKLGRWLGRTSTPQAGDVVFFSNGKRACHVGIVEKRLSSTRVQTIEGNTSTSSNDNGGAVMRRTRNYGTVGSSWYVLGFFRPAWSGSSSGSTSTNSGSGGSTTSSSGIAVDGLWGKGTTRALQRVLGTTADGIVSHQYSAYRSSNPGLLSSSWQWEQEPGGSSAVVKAMQRQLGVTADGHIGPATIKAIQKHLGTVQDGKISKPSACVKALQDRLNSGKF